MARMIKRKWRRFYKRHIVALDMVGNFLGALSIFVFLYVAYMFLWLMGGN